MRGPWARLFLVLSLAASTAAARGVPIYEAKPAQLKSAQQTFEAGDRLYEAREFKQAITTFRASHDIVASPNSSLMIARCQRELGQMREAMASFREAHAEAKAAADRDKKKYGATLDAIVQEMGELDAKLGRVTIELVNAPAGTSVSIGNDRIPESTLAEPVPVAAGAVTITAIDPSGVKVSQKVDVAAGQNERVRLEFAEAPPTEVAPVPKAEPPPPDEPPKPREPDAAPRAFPTRAWAYVAGGVGVAGLVTFGVFGAMSNSKYSSLEEDCIDDHCPPERGSDIDSGKTYQTIANVGLAIGVIGVGTGVAFYFLSDRPDSAPKAVNAPRVRLGLGSVALESRF